MSGFSSTTGARAKLQQGKNFNAGPGQYRDRPPSSPVGSTVFAVFLVAILLAVALTEVYLTGAAGVKSGIAWIDGYLLAAPAPAVIGHVGADYALVILARGFALFAMAGFVPMMTALWYRLRDRDPVNPYVSVWATGLVLVVIYVLVDYFVPGFGDFVYSMAV